MTSVTKFGKTMKAILDKITSLSRQDRSTVFKWLMSHCTEENLKGCFRELDGRKAVGADGISKEDFAENLDGNIQELHGNLKAMKYRPGPVKEVLIPKGKGKYRPLGISNIVDKIVQSMLAKLLEAIYEPLWDSSAYGFRKGKSAHMAIRDALAYMKRHKVEEVIDVDLENFFGTIRHDVLLELLTQKIGDSRFLEYIKRLLKAVTITKDGIKKRDVGLPQGSILSPVLANIYAHHVIDLWFKEVVPQHITGRVKIFRYCDDLIICVSDKRATSKITRSLEKRLSKYGLKLNEEKTKRVSFDKYALDGGEAQGSFDFLGFTFYLTRARQGFVTTKVKTSKKSMRVKLSNVKKWVQGNRSKGTLLDIWKEFCIKMRGHIEYYGVSCNSQSVGNFLWRARRIVFKWMNRRSQAKSLTWEEFSRFEKRHPLPRVKIYHALYDPASA